MELHPAHTECSMHVHQNCHPGNPWMWSPSAQTPARPRARVPLTALGPGAPLPYPVSTHPSWGLPRGSAGWTKILTFYFGRKDGVSIAGAASEPLRQQQANEVVWRGHGWGVAAWTSTRTSRTLPAQAGEMQAQAVGQEPRPQHTHKAKRGAELLFKML